MESTTLNYSNDNIMITTIMIMIFNNSCNDDNNKNDSKNDHYDNCQQFDIEYKCLHIIS